MRMRLRAIGKVARGRALGDVRCALCAMHLVAASSVEQLAVGVCHQRYKVCSCGRIRRRWFQVRSILAPFAVGQNAARGRVGRGQRKDTDCDCGRRSVESFASDELITNSDGLVAANECESGAVAAAVSCTLLVLALLAPRRAVCGLDDSKGALCG